MATSDDRLFHSCYAIDVKVGKQKATISDSARGKWNVDLADEDLKKQFKTWLATVFLKGAAQTLTVFEYKDLSNEDEQDFDFWIKKFCNLPEA